MQIKGLSPDQPTTENSAGGKQSASPYRLDLIPPLAILRESEVLATGAKKYGENNWKKIEIKDHLNHILQHVYAYLAHDASDDHLANISCRAHFALELQEEFNQKMKGDLEHVGPANAKLAVEMPRPIVCIDCKGPLEQSYYGAGDGTGQKFRCYKCHEALEKTRKTLNSL